MLSVSSVQRDVETMAELVTVYKAIPAEVPRVIGYLENRCLHPVVLDDAENVSAYRSHAHEIRIAVPQTERDMAVQILDQREQEDKLRLFPVVKRANVVVYILIAALGALAIVGLLDRRGFWFIGFGILLTIVAAFALVRRAWATQEDHNGRAKR